MAHPSASREAWTSCAGILSKGSIFEEIVVPVAFRWAQVHKDELFGPRGGSRAYFRAHDRASVTPRVVGRGQRDGGAQGLAVAQLLTKRERGMLLGHR